MSQTRRLAAILAADVAGYSRLMGADEEGTLERLKALRRAVPGQCRSRTAAPAGGPNGLAEGAENDHDQRHPD
jgi:hypothetical protein